MAILARLTANAFTQLLVMLVSKCSSRKRHFRSSATALALQGSQNKSARVSGCYLISCTVRLVERLIKLFCLLCLMPTFFHLCIRSQRPRASFVLTGLLRSSLPFGRRDTKCGAPINRHDCKHQICKHRRYATITWPCLAES